MGTQITIIGGPQATNLEPCMCAQMSPIFGNAVDEGAHGYLAQLAQEAWEDCRQCRGQGGVEVTLPEHQIDWCGGNAAAIFQLLGWDPQGGEATLPDARRALMLARSRNPGSVVRDPELTYAPATREDGVVELRSLRMISMGLDVEGVDERIERLAHLVETAADLGCSGISWG